MTTPSTTASIPIPSKNNSPERGELRRALIIFGLLSAAALIQLLIQANNSGPILGHFGRGRLLRMLPVTLVMAAAAAGWKQPSLGWIERGYLHLQTGLARLGRVFNVLGWVGVLALFGALTWSPLHARLALIAPDAWLLGAAIFAGAFFWQAAGVGRSYLGSLAATAVVYGVAYRLSAFLPDLSASPFSLAWSEASRYYNASLFLANSVYGASAPLPVLHPSRYLLQAVPFLIPSLPLWFHRLWQVLLWVGMGGAGAALLTRRLKVENRGLAALLTGWGFLFLNQGPVYYHLMGCVILVLWGFDRRHFGRSLAVVLIASAWAGISRINWVPVPGLMAAMLYLLEEKMDGRSLFRYLLAPAVLAVAGTALAYGVDKLYQRFSGNPILMFDSSFSSSLLWYRLFPSATYPTGILLGIAIATLPLVYVLLAAWGRSMFAWHLIRPLGVGTILGVFFAGGLVVSVKIGGGSNLHNMDAFLALLLVAGAYLGVNRFEPDFPDRFIPWRATWIPVGLLVVVPLLPLLGAGGPLHPVDSAQAQAELQTLQSYLDGVNGQPGEVLFITERQLVTFHLVQGVTHVPAYEKVFLMEMAMANNRPYLDGFERDLREHRFSLIVSEPVGTALQDETHGFGEENNAWVERVNLPLLQYYQRKALLEGPAPIEILEPKP